MTAATTNIEQVLAAKFANRRDITLIDFLRATRRSSADQKNKITQSTSGVAQLVSVDDCDINACSCTTATFGLRC
jgi:hypothetical protein